MTMQVGMIGVDGVLLASDMRWTHIECPWSTFENSKIVTSENGIAISKARDMVLAGQIADSILLNLGEKEMHSPESAIKDIAAKVCSHVEESIQAECLIVVTKPSVRLFYLGRGTEVGIDCHETRTFEYAGERSPAIFWAQRYYDKKKSIEELVPLAAHLISSASEISKPSIGGLEILLCKENGIVPISNKEIRSLESNSSRWSTQIESLIFGNSRT